MQIFLTQSQSLFPLIHCFTLVPLNRVTCVFIIIKRLHFFLNFYLFFGDLVFYTCLPFSFLSLCIFYCRLVLPRASHTPES